MHVLLYGSKSIITCRGTYIYIDYFEDTLLYDAKPLQKKHAQEVFCCHGFLQSKPFNGYEDWVEELLRISSIFPLCLKVLGKKDTEMTFAKRIVYEQGNETTCLSPISIRYYDSELKNGVYKVYLQFVKI